MAPPAGPDFDQPHRIAQRRLHGGDAARRHHQQQGTRDAFLLQVGLELAEIARHARQHVGVGDGGRGALVLADLRTDLAGERDRHARQLLGQDRAGAPLMRFGGEAVQEADGDGLDFAAAQLGRDVAHRLLVERQQHGAVGRHPLGYAEAQIARHQRIGPLHVDVVLLEAVLPGHLERVAEALGGEQRGAGALALDQRVGGERGAVHHQTDIGRPALGLGQDGAHAFQHGALGRVGRGQELDGVSPSIVRYSGLQHNVGESAADIDGQARQHHSSALMLPLAITSAH